MLSQNHIIVINLMKNKEKKQIKKLFGIYKQVINTISHLDKTKAYRKKLIIRCNQISEETGVPFRKLQIVK